MFQSLVYLTFVCLFKGLDSVSGSPEPQHVSYYRTKISSWLLDVGKEQWNRRESLARAPCHWCWGNLIKKLSPWTCFLHLKVFILLWAFISSTIGCFLQDSILKITIRYFLGEEEILTLQTLVLYLPFKPGELWPVTHYHPCCNLSIVPRLNAIWLEITPTANSKYHTIK